MTRKHEKPSLYRDLKDVLTGRFTSDIGSQPILEDLVSSTIKTRTQWIILEKAYYDEEKAHKVRRFLVNARNFLCQSPLDVWHEIYWSIKIFIQRGRRGYSDRDLWSFDDYLSSVIVQAIPDFYKQSSKVVLAPTYDENGAYSHFTMPLNCGGPPDEEEKQAQAQWKDILDEIVLGFKMWRDDNWWLPDDNGEYPKYESGYPPELEKSFALLLKWWGALGS